MPFAGGLPSLRLSDRALYQEIDVFWLNLDF